DVDEAKASGDRVRIAKLVRRLAASRVSWGSNTPAHRVEMMRRLFERSTVRLVRDVRAEYIRLYGEDPEVTIGSDGLGQPIARLDRAIDRARARNQRGGFRRDAGDDREQASAS